MRCRGRKVTYLLLSESNGLNQREVAGRAGAVGGIEVRVADAMAGEAAGDDRAADLHRVGTWCNVAGAAGQNGVGMRLGHQFRVVEVCEADIARPRLNRRPPLHFLLDGTIVALRTVVWERPEILTWLTRPCVAPNAVGKERPVLPVVEAILNHSGAGGSQDSGSA
jgi:hypothetical protein